MFEVRQQIVLRRSTLAVWCKCYTEKQASQQEQKAAARTTQEAGTLLGQRQDGDEVRHRGEDAVTM